MKCLIFQSHIDEKEVLKEYQQYLQKHETMSEEDVRYVEEDLRSPCTQEIAALEHSEMWIRLTMLL